MDYSGIIEQLGALMVQQNEIARQLQKYADRIALGQVLAIPDITNLAQSLQDMDSRFQVIVAPLQFDAMKASAFRDIPDILRQLKVLQDRGQELFSQAASIYRTFLLLESNKESYQKPLQDEKCRVQDLLRETESVFAADPEEVRRKADIYEGFLRCVQDEDAIDRDAALAASLEAYFPALLYRGLLRNAYSLTDGLPPEPAPGLPPIAEPDAEVPGTSQMEPAADPDQLKQPDDKAKADAPVGKTAESMALRRLEIYPALTLSSIKTKDFQKRLSGQPACSHLLNHIVGYWLIGRRHLADCLEAPNDQTALSRDLEYLYKYGFVMRIRDVDAGEDYYAASKLTIDWLNHGGRLAAAAGNVKIDPTQFTAYTPVDVDKLRKSVEYKLHCFSTMLLTDTLHAMQDADERIAYNGLTLWKMTSDTAGAELVNEISPEMGLGSARSIVAFAAEIKLERIRDLLEEFFAGSQSAGRPRYVLCSTREQAAEIERLASQAIELKPQLASCVILRFDSPTQVVRAHVVSITGQLRKMTLAEAEKIALEQAQAGEPSAAEKNEPIETLSDGEPSDIALPDPAPEAGPMEEQVPSSGPDQVPELETALPTVPEREIEPDLASKPASKVKPGLAAAPSSEVEPDLAAALPPEVEPVPVAAPSPEVEPVPVAAPSPEVEPAPVVAPSPEAEPASLAVLAPEKEPSPPVVLESEGEPDIQVDVPIGETDESQSGDLAITEFPTDYAAEVDDDATPDSVAGPEVDSATFSHDMVLEDLVRIALTNESLNNAPDGLVELILLKLIDRDQWGAALTLAKAIDGSGPQNASWSRYIAYATGMDSERTSMNGTSLTSTFERILIGEDASLASQAMMVAATIRTLFAPDSDYYDYALITQAENLNAGVVSLGFQYAAPIKSLINSLMQFVSEHNLGFSEAILDSFKSKEHVESQVRSISQRAHSLLENRLQKLTSTKVNNVPYQNALSLCFNSSSEIASILRWLEQDDKAHWTEISAFSRQFFVGSKGQETVNDEAVGDYIEKFMRQISNSLNKPFSIRYEARTEFVRKITSVVKLAHEYAVVRKPMDRAASHGITSERIASYRSEILNHCDAALTSAQPVLHLTANGSAELAKASTKIILQVVSEIAAKLRGNYEDRGKWLFADFLKTSHVELDVSLRPILHPEFNALHSHACWRLVLRHIADLNGHTLNSALERIFFGDTLEKDDFGVARQILDYANDTSQMDLIDDERYTVNLIAQSEQQVKARSKKETEALLSLFELAYAQGRITFVEKEDILLKIQNWINYYSERSNYGHLKRLIKAFEHQIQYMANFRKGDYLAKYEQLEEEKQGELESWPILGKIKDLIQKQNFVVAEELMNLAKDYGIQHDPNENVKLEITGFDTFIKRIPDYYEFCKGPSGINLVKVREQYFKSKNVHGRLPAKDEKSAIDLLNAWPGSVRESTKDRIGDIMVKIGFDVTSVALMTTTDPKVAKFSVTISRVPRNLRDYAHPIPEYGTLVPNNTLTVICIFGTFSANDLNKKIKALNPGPNCILLLDSALSLQDRRKFVKDYKMGSSLQNSLLLIDRILALHMSILSATERQDVMLRCTLPFTYVNPYSITSGKVSDEMFFGRRTELHDLTSYGGKCLVYGGRQLGKTALLRRAESLIDNPENREYAIFLDIKTLKVNDVLKCVCQALKDRRLKVPVCKDWQELRTVLDGLINGGETGRVKRILLLLDEADDFLTDCIENDYSPIREIKLLHDSTQFRFKCVMAGLHNVVRFSESTRNNGDLAQFGTAIRVSPLSYNDAKDLIERPLRYLGFHLENKDLLSLILSHTNYFPGLIHFFCHTLIQVYTNRYSDFCNELKSPPYSLSENNIQKILQDQQMMAVIREKFFFTINLDERYTALAYSLAYKYLTDNDEYHDYSRGYEISEILKEANAIRSIEVLKRESVKNLLDEMVDLGVLRKAATSNYLFNRLNYLTLFGNQDEVLNKLYELAEQSQGE